MFDSRKEQRKAKYKEGRLSQESCNFDELAKIRACLEKVHEESEPGSHSVRQENPIQAEGIANAEVLRQGDA